MMSPDALSLRPRDRRAVLPNGLPVYGATRGDVRAQPLMLGYFRSAVPLRRGMTVIDVGANIGLFSLEVLRRCDGDVQLMAFEPAPEPFAALERNVGELFPHARARLYRQAVGARRGHATLLYRPRASGTSSLEAGPTGDPDAFIDAMLREPPARYRGVFPGWFRRLPRPLARRLLRLAARWAARRVLETPCAVTTISDVLRDHAIERVDFLKVDVEGAELDVLRGIALRDWPKIESLAVEVHDVDHRLATVLTALESAGFDEIQVEQEWPFEGTELHMVHAWRVRTAPAQPAIAHRG